jgi:CBS domain-containing protein
MITAQNVMTRDVTTIPADATVGKLIKTIKSKNYSGLPVVDDAGKAIGVVSQNDVLRALAYIVSSGKLGKAFQAGKRKASLALLEAGKGAALDKFLKMPVKKIMTPTVEACTPATPVGQVCEQMASKRIHRVVVLQDGKVAGLISATDLVRRFGESLNSNPAAR